MLQRIRNARYVEGKIMIKPKLSSTSSVVRVSENVLEFFKTNTREQVKIKVEDDAILNIVLDMDGTQDLKVLSEKHHIQYDSLNTLIAFLDRKGILDHVDPKDDFDSYNSYRRVIHFLSDFSESHEHLLSMWNRLRNATVLIIGLGAVGSWVACNLIQSGIKNLILMDGDTVDISNLHRQFGYRECDIGQKKADVLEQRLKEYSTDINIIKCYDYLNEETLSQFDNQNIDLIINCADKPTVDMTSLWVGEYGMKHNIPHIVGGGYNLHLSLIGQTVIPHKSACVKCFQMHLEEQNKIDPNRVKKLAVKNRKVGSFGPMCSMIASMVGMEAIKILSGCIVPANINRRGEFDIYTMDITYNKFLRRDDCEWCGKKGRYKDT